VQTPKKVLFKSPIAILLITVALVLTFQATALLSQYVSHQASIHSALDKVERRISLDSAFLDVGNETLSTPVNQFAIYRYLNRLNKSLKEQGYPILVSNIQGIFLSPEQLSDYPVVVTSTLSNAEQTITVEMRSKAAESFFAFSWIALIAALAVAPFFAVTNQRRLRKKVIEEILPPTPKLIINLQDKTISNGVDDKVVTLQNKPLCFYTALVKYCIAHPNESLPPHKDVPSELMALANKCFGRLIELGHTKRKRPDFNANLDKTLSEIRAALDEVFCSFNDEKENYYPPRAQGEGSRSKQHSYALPHITIEDIEIIGN
jgi:hypothetical protein